MKLKSCPEDFIVDEVNCFTPDPGGRFFVYELEKRSLSTLEALGIIARHADIRAHDLSASGLKDKHGLTRQLFSSPRALPGNIEDGRIRIRLVGKSGERLTAGFIDGNRFEITLRNLKQHEIEVIPRNVTEIEKYGIPNYYDNQRFGGIAHGQGFIGKALAVGDFKEALRLHLAAPHRKQNLRDKTNRKLAARHWGDWQTLHKKMKRSSERALVEYLIDHPEDYSGCFERITPSLRNMFVAAYQSYLFNESLRKLVESETAYESVKYKAGSLAFYHEIRPDVLERWSSEMLPLPGPATKLDEYELAQSVLDVLKDEGIQLNQLTLPGLTRTGFKASHRPLLMWPKDFNCSDPEPDDLNEHAQKVVLKFQLGRGSFATIVTRRLVLSARP